MRMDHLQYLIEIDRQHSISAAAQELYLGQTTLSSIVKAVEEELGFSVFCRTHSGVQTTLEGEEALALIWEINARFEEIQNLKIRASSPQPVPILLSPSINETLALPVNQLFTALEPDGNLEFHTIMGEHVGPQVIKNEGNIGLTYYSKNDLEEFRVVAAKYQVEVEVLMEDHLCLLVRADHPLAHRTEINPKDISNCHFAMLPHFISYEESMAYIQRFGAGNCYTIFPNISAIQEAVYDQNMVSILSGYTSQCPSFPGKMKFSSVSLSGTKSESAIYLCLIHRGDSNIRYQEKTVIRCIKECLQNMMSSSK